MAKLIDCMVDTAAVHNRILIVHREATKAITLHLVMGSGMFPGRITHHIELNANEIAKLKEVIAQL